jgi:hypothetical protein
MIAGNESAVRNAWHIFAFRGEALTRFDSGPEAFRQSWLALALSLPLALFGVAVLNLKVSDPVPLLPLALFICLNWLVGVGGIVFFAFLTRQSAKLTTTIIISNWVSLWANLFFVLPSLLVLVGLPLGAFGWCQLGMILYFSAVQGFVLWRLWQINIGLVVGIMVALFLVDRFTNELFIALTGPPAAAIPAKAHG